MGRLHCFISLSREDRAALLRAFRSLLAWRLGLWLLPVHTLRWIARTPVRGLRRSSPGAGLRNCSAGSPSSVECVAWAVKTAARYVPRASCLTQALAAQSLLGRSGHPSQLHIGVAKGPDREFGAHAWVQCHDRVVIGGSDLNRYTPLLYWEGAPGRW